MSKSMLVASDKDTWQHISDHLNVKNCEISFFELKGTLEEIKNELERVNYSLLMLKVEILDQSELLPLLEDLNAPRGDHLFLATGVCLL